MIYYIFLAFKGRLLETGIYYKVFRITGFFKATKTPNLKTQKYKKTALPLKNTPAI